MVIIAKDDISNITQTDRENDCLTLTNNCVIVNEVRRDNFFKIIAFKMQFLKASTNIDVLVYSFGIVVSLIFFVITQVFHEYIFDLKIVMAIVN